MDTDLYFLNAARQCEINELQQLLHTSDWVRALGELIHALQKERGLSSIVLASQGRRGHTALQAQRKISDQAGLHWRQALSQLNLDGLQGGQGARLFSHIAYVLQGLQALPDLRTCISAHRLSVTASTNAYIRVIAGLLAVVFEAADSATYPGISRLLVAMFHFMQGKEWAGQERATGGAAFGAGTSELPRQQHWLHLIESQERCFQVFAECAPPALVQDWQRSCAAGPDVTTIERLRRVGCTAADGAALDSACSEAWFDACSRVMDGMHRLETQLAQALTAECQTQLAVAQKALAQTPQPGPAPSTDAHGMPAFFSDPAPSPLDARWAPPLQLSVLQVVQEQSQRLLAMRHELDSVRQALDERKTLERAKGVLMTHQKLSEDAAHKLLRQTAMQQNRRIVEVALAVLSTADLLVKPAA